MQRGIFYALSPALFLAAICGCASGKSSSPSIASKADSDPGLIASTTSSMKKGFKSAGAALTPKKKEETPPDPLALSNDTKPAGAELHLAAARLLESKNDLAQAATAYEKALKAEPTNLAALLAYARMQDRQGNLNEATTLYQQAIKHHPKDASAYNDLGLCYARRMMLDEAGVALAKAVELNPDRKLYRNNLAAVRVEQGRMDDALAQLRLAHGPAVAHYNLGYLLSQKGSRDAAIFHFNQALVADPTLADAQNWLDRLGANPGPAISSRRNETTPLAPLPAVTAGPETQPQSGPEWKKPQPVANAPTPPPTPDYLKSGGSGYQVRYPNPVRDRQTSGEEEIPPTPDHLEASPPPAQRSNSDALKLLPPVNSAYFAPSRF